MKSFALALMMFTAPGSSHSHFVDPFDVYMSGVKAGRPGRELSGYAAECQVPVAGVPSTYAIGGSEWKQVPSLSGAVRNLASDHFSTLQMWKSDRRRFVVVWSYDLEQEYRDSYCFGEDGALRFEDNRAWMFELPSGKGWSHLRRWTPDATGRLVANSGHFSTMDGNPIPKPRLDPDEQKNLEYHTDFKRLNDLKLPSAMLR
jgi:hypothetical protein